jgi:RimJ/RimL family protein N-acetyltransferase
MVWRRKHKIVAIPAEPAEKPALRVVETNRMVLVAANADLVRADLEGGEALAEMLNARVPSNWPPDLYDREAMQYALRMLEDSTAPGWSFWYLMLRAEQSNPGSTSGSVPGRAKRQAEGQAQLVGICGFKGRPDSSGSTEIGYSIIDRFRNKGLASEAVERLVRWAFSHQTVHEVSAETLPHLQSSIRVMKKNGFEFIGAGSELGVVRYAVQRPDLR